jgi:hypothetical protein
MRSSSSSKSKIGRKRPSKTKLKKAELARVQQEIQRLRQEQKAITRRKVTTQCAEARRQHINRERATLMELQYTVEILRQHEERQEPPFKQPHH